MILYYNSINSNKIRNRNKLRVGYIVRQYSNVENFKPKWYKTFRFKKQAITYLLNSPKKEDLHIMKCAYLEHDEYLKVLEYYEYYKGKISKINDYWDIYIPIFKGRKYTKLRKFYKIYEKLNNIIQHTESEEVLLETINKLMILLNSRNIKVDDSCIEFFKNTIKRYCSCENKIDIIITLKSDISYYSDRCCEERVYTLIKVWEYIKTNYYD